MAVIDDGTVSYDIRYVRFSDASHQTSNNENGILEFCSERVDSK